MQHQLFLLTWNTLSCSINTFLSTQDCFLCNIKLLVATKKYFSFNTKFFFLTSFRLLCQSDIFLLSHSNKILIKCQKINKISFLCATKKIFLFFNVHHNFLYSVFTLHNVSMLIFFIVVFETKKLSIDLLLTCLMYKAVTK